MHQRSAVPSGGFNHAVKEACHLQSGGKVGIETSEDMHDWHDVYLLATTFSGTGGHGLPCPPEGRDNSWRGLEARSEVRTNEESWSKPKSSGQSSFFSANTEVGRGSKSKGAKIYILINLLHSIRDTSVPCRKPFVPLLALLLPSLLFVAGLCSNSEKF